MTTENGAYKEFLLSALRVSSLRCKLMDAELTSIGIALRGGLIDVEAAAQWIRDENLLWLVGERLEGIKIAAEVEAADEKHAAQMME